MPNRWVCLGILLFWAGMTGWLVVREFNYRFGARPQLQDALAESSLAGIVNWTVYEVSRAGPESSPRTQRLGRATSQVILDPRTSDYRLVQSLNLDRVFQLPFSLNLTSRAEVNLFGNLRSLHLRAHLESAPALHILLESNIRPSAGDKGELRVSTAVRLREGNDAKERTLYEDRTTVRYDGKDLILSSLCPLDRLPGLRPGQSWETPLVDPMQSVPQALNQAAVGSFTLDRPVSKVQIRDELEGLLWNGDFQPCLILETNQGSVVVRIWVRESDGLVLKQSATWGMFTETTLEVIRDEKPVPPQQ